MAMFYFSSDQRAQGPGYELMIRQHSCDDFMNIHENHVDHVRQNTMCDQIITRERDVITSPFYPNDYGLGLKCRYTIVRSSSDVCYVRLRFLSFDIEPSPECRSDYLMLDATRERLCRSNMIPTERTLPFAADGQIKLTFSSDSRVSRPGFKIMMDQLRGSCSSSFTPHVGIIGAWNVSGRPGAPPVKTGINRFGSVLPDQSRICNTTSASFVMIASEGYPIQYRANTDCIYRIKRHDARVCSLDVFFQDFSVGTWDNGRCINDFLKIADQHYCGYRRNERLLIEFPVGVDYIDLRFFTDDVVNYPGFVIEVRQVDRCSAVLPAPYVPLPGPVVPYDASSGFKGVGPVYRSDSTPIGVSAGSAYCGPQVLTDEKFEMLSPGYEKGGYSRFTDCHYTIRKTHYTVCALEVKFKTFSLEDSRACEHDFLQIGSSVKLCGKMPFDTTSE